MTHDLLNSVIPELGGSVRHILISSLKDDTYFAQIVIRRGETEIKVDSRPSDAVALAVRAGVSIYAAEEVLDEAGVLVDPETGDYAYARDPDGSEGREVTEDELRRLSAFKEFVEELNMDPEVSAEELRGLSAFNDAVEEINLDLGNEQRKD